MNIYKYITTTKKIGKTCHFRMWSIFQGRKGKSNNPFWFVTSFLLRQIIITLLLPSNYLVPKALPFLEDHANGREYWVPLAADLPSTLKCRLCCCCPGTWCKIIFSISEKTALKAGFFTLIGTQFRFRFHTLLCKRDIS